VKPAHPQSRYLEKRERMGRHDWYRLTTWSEEDQAGFFSKLNRSRKAFHKAQYLNVQAYYLESTGDVELIKSALVLVEMVISEWPDPFSLASAYQTKGKCLVKLSKNYEAIEAYRKAIEAEEAYPTVVTDAAYQYCWLIVTNEIKELYSEALAVLGKNVDVLIFPYHEFIFYGVQALILADSGNTEEASQAAKKALGAAAKTESGFTYHKKEGLVGRQEDSLMQKLWKIAGS